MVPKSAARTAWAIDVHKNLLTRVCKHQLNDLNDTRCTRIVIAEPRQAETETSLRGEHLTVRRIAAPRPSRPRSWCVSPNNCFSSLICLDCAGGARIPFSKDLAPTREAALRGCLSSCLAP